MRILITGGAGFVGSHVVEAYLAEGHEVRVVDNLTTGRISNLDARAKLYEMDIQSPGLDEVFAEYRPEVVNHHAAQASVKLSTHDPLKDLQQNAGCTARIAMLCAEHGVGKLIYSSSGGTVYGEPERLPLDESHPLAPVSPYGLSKLIGEQYLQLYGRTHGLNFTILRYSNAFGPRQDPNGEAGVVAIFTGKMLAQEPCTIDGDGEQKKDYVYVGDIARANVMALAASPGATMNIGTGRGISVNEIFEALNAETGNEIPARSGPPRPGDVRNFWLDNSHAREQMGWQPEVGFVEGIRLTVQSFLEPKG
jgi:UDP-glucose 4-epimerase